MRIGLLFMLALTWPLLGANCVPLLDINQPAAREGETLAAAVLSPTSDQTVALGSTVAIEWTVMNLTGDEAIVTILVERRPDLAQTILVGGLRPEGTQGGGVFDWDTTDFAAGEYVVVLTVEAGARSRRATGSGRVTLDEPPSFQFDLPTEDVTLETDGTVTIGWTGGDREGNGTAQLGIDPDTDHESGNETIIAEESLPTSPDTRTLDWDGNDQDGTPVAGGTYNLFALVSDGVSPTQTIEGLALITVPETNEGDNGDNGDGPTQTAFTQPEEDTEFLVGGDPLTIAFTLSLTEDVLLDLKIDTDDSHANGNETTILSQRSETADVTEDSFDWDGTDASGDAVDPGIYRVFMLLSTGVGTPTTVEADTLVFRRSNADQPLIALLEPASVRTVNPGDFLTIRWRDEDPGENATIRISIDDDNTPSEPSENGEAEIDILTGRAADDDGVLDTFTYQIPSSLTPGTYYVFAYITSGGGTVLQNTSVAPAAFIVDDPASGN